MISKVPDFRLSLLGKELIPVQTGKDLGVTFDSSLSFDCHVVKTVASCMSSLAQINCVKHVLDKSLLVLVIRSLVFSKMYYCSSVWANTTANNIRRLQAVQNFAVRIITKSRKFDHITPLLTELHWIPVKLYLLYRDAVLTKRNNTGIFVSIICEESRHQWTLHEELKFFEHPLFQEFNWPTDILLPRCLLMERTSREH
jgi:hypothetical protein